MLVFIDDSGDAGFKLGRGSTPYFVICCVIFDDELDAERAAVEIKTLRRTLGVSDRFEFKFTGSNKDTRVAFMQCISKLNFRVRAIRVDKSKIRLEELKTKKAKFYNYTIKLVLSHCNGTLVDANIKLDGTADRTYRREAEAYLRRELNTKGNRLIKKIAFKKSHDSVLIQMADMIAGAINRERQVDKTDAALYLSYLRAAGKIQSLWDFPNK